MLPPLNRKPRKPKGKPLKRTDADIDALAGGVPTADELAELLARTEAVSPLLAKLMQAEDNEDATTNGA